MIVNLRKEVITLNWDNMVLDFQFIKKKSQNIQKGKYFATRK